MTRVVVDDPILVTRKRVGQNGQVYVGKQYAGKEIELIITEVKTNDTSHPESGDGQQASGES
jgi:hypothetical protein